LAAFYGKIDITQVLLDNGASCEMYDNEGDTPLIKAVTSGYYQIVELLLVRGANINAQNELGNTALHVAATANTDRYNDMAIVRCLLDNGADVFLKNKKNKTPLQVAKYSEMADMIEGTLKYYI